MGTDVSGGYSPSMLTAIQHASIASKVIAIQATPLPGSAETNPIPPSPSSMTSASQTLLAMADSSPPPLTNRPLPPVVLLHMATLGGAKLCNLETHTGSLAAGKAFDALLVNLSNEAGNPNVWWDDVEEGGGERSPGKCVEDLEASLEKFLFCGDDRNISGVFVQGRLVGGRKFAKGVL